ncbi:hypothetical protein FZC66_06675 [Priestia megaterium]|nr:hypothetical protein FZC66_06675 [Priestia megaterium]
MNFLSAFQMSNYIQKEMEQLQTRLAPLTKKVSRYMFWSLPLIAVSAFNLIFLLFNEPLNRETLPVILMYAVIGALGMALSKETKIKRKEVQKVGADYAIERIQSSEIVSPYRKEEYIQQIKAQPLAAMAYFIQFLNEEENRMKREEM